MYGYKNTVQYCYLAKSLESLLSNHPNFSSTTTTMVIVSPSSNEFLANTTATVSHVSDTVSLGASVTEHSPTPSIFLPMDSNYTSDTSFWIKDLYVYDLKVKIIYNFMFSQELGRKLV